MSGVCRQLGLIRCPSYDYVCMYKHLQALSCTGYSPLGTTSLVRKTAKESNVVHYKTSGNLCQKFCQDSLDMANKASWPLVRHI